MKIRNIPPAYFFTGIIAVAVICFLLPQYEIIVFPYNLSGVLLILIGGFLNMNAEKLMKKYDTPHKFEKSTRVVQEGVFKFSRNPMYLGMTLILLGLAAMSQNIVTFVSPVAFFVLMNRIFIPYEEKKIHDELGEEFLRYKKKVRRWI